MLQYIRSEEYSVAGLKPDAGLHGSYRAKHKHFLRKCHKIKVEVTVFYVNEKTDPVLTKSLEI
jgi:hypothetical protein